MKNTVVTIYEKPLTEERPEGEARLINKVMEKGSLELWSVKFTDDGFKAQRWIKKPQN